MPEQNKTNVIETILKHPFSFAFAMHSILSTIQCLRTGKLTPFFNFTFNAVRKDKTPEA